jgi:RHS repeat-associated protein
VTTIYVSDDSREVLEYDGTSGQMLRRYTHGRGLDEALNQIAPTRQRSILVPDVQGSTVATVDSATGAVIAAGYKPFGETADTTGSFRYTGRRIDDETLGLYYYRARMYAPTLGRFLQPDPIGYAGGNNLYAYVGSDPLNQVDPSGLLAGQIGSGTWSLVKSGALVPGGGAGLQASAEFQQGNYGSAALQFGRGLAESALALATLGDGQLLLQGGRAATESAPSFSAIGSTGQVGEQWLANDLGGTSQAYFSTSQGARYVDQFANGIAMSQKLAIRR